MAVTRDRKIVVKPRPPCLVCGKTIYWARRFDHDGCKKN